MDKAVVVSTDWLSHHRLDADVVVVDVRAPHYFAQGHIPGAANLPLVLLTAQPGSPVDGSRTAQFLGLAGARVDSHVVVYDDGASTTASQLFWLMRYYHHPKISVLDGGITKWLHEGRASDLNGTITPSEYVVGSPDKSSLATLDDVRAAIDDPESIIVDVRSPAEFLGLQRTARRNGHIPGALNIDWSTSLAHDEDGVAQLLPDDKLRELFTRAGLKPETNVILHCQSGGRSSTSYLVLKKLGYENVRNYVGGWQEWGNRDDTPIDET